jgi:opacity protein-like surface antigen
MRSTLLLLACAAVTSAPAAADVYVGGGITASDYRVPNPSGLQPFDDEDGGHKLLGGWRVLDTFGVDLSYADHGDVTVPTRIFCVALVGVPCPTANEYSAKTLSVFAVGYLDLPFVDLFAKAGVSSAELDTRTLFNVPVPATAVASSEQGLAWGAGVEARVRSVGVRLEYERFDDVAADDLDALSLSLVWTFD